MEPQTCNCKNTRCLKLYCVCFRQGKFQGMWAAAPFESRSWTLVVGDFASLQHDACMPRRSHTCPPEVLGADLQHLPHPCTLPPPTCNRPVLPGLQVHGMQEHARTRERGGGDAQAHPGQELHGLDIQGEHMSILRCNS